MSAEMYGVQVVTKMIQWSRKFMSEMQCVQDKPTSIKEDNFPLIQMLDKQISAKIMKKHVLLKTDYVKDAKANGEITLMWVPTDEMIADILTKPMVGKKYLRMRNMITNNI